MYSILIFFVEVYIQWSNYTVVRSVKKIIWNSSWLAGCPWNYWYFSSCTSVFYGDMCFNIVVFWNLIIVTFVTSIFYVFFHTYKLWWLNTYNGGKLPLWKPCTSTKLQIAAHFSKIKLDSTNTFAHHCRCYSVQRAKLRLFRGMILIFLF